MITEISLKNLCVQYEKRTTAGIHHINFNFEKGKFYSFIGPSGSGKTTLLKSLASIITPNSGEITLNHQTKICFIDQFTNLDQNETVFNNLNQILKHSSFSEDQSENQIRSTLTQLNLTNEIHSPITQISAGQRQRVILASALIQNPSIIAMDEPFANLDHCLRQEILEELLPLFKEKEITLLWSTHNINEALNYSDEVLLLNYGKLVQAGSPQDIYYKPQSLFSAQFFQLHNLIPAKLKTAHQDTLEIDVFKETHHLPRPETFSKADHHNDVLLLIHPEYITLGENLPYKGKILSKSFHGEVSTLKIGFQDHELTCKIFSHQVPKTQSINFDILFSKVHCLSEV